MNKSLKFTLLLLFGMLSFCNSKAQDNDKSNFSTSVSLVNRFVWRGIFLDGNPNIQPLLTYSSGGFTAGAWGSFNFIGGYAQTNFFAQYSAHGFTAKVMDHYIGDDQLENDVNYFDYNDETTNHLFEFSLQYSLRGFSVLGSTFFYGGDDDENNQNRYSSYAELGYAFPVKDYNFNLFVGTALNEGVYADSFAVVSVGVTAKKEVRITDKFSIPIGFSIAANPDKEKMHFLLEITLK